jgi:hypothetical protein
MKETHGLSVDLRLIRIRIECGELPMQRRLRVFIRWLKLSSKDSECHFRLHDPPVRHLWKKAQKVTKY